MSGMRLLLRIAPIVIAVIVFLFGTQGVTAQTTYTWDGGGTTTAWSEAANWNPNTVPGSSDIALFDGTSSKIAEITSATGVGTITVSSTSVYNQTIRLLADLTVGTLNIGNVSNNNTLILNGGFNFLIVNTEAVLTTGGKLEGTGTVNLYGSVEMVTPADKVTYFGPNIVTELYATQTLTSDLVFYGNVDLNLKSVTLGIYNLYLGPYATLSGYATAVDGKKNLPGSIFNIGGNAITSPPQGHLCKGFLAATEDTPFIFPMTVTGQRITHLQIEIPSACTSGSYDLTVAPFPHMSVRAVYHHNDNHPAATVGATMWFHWSVKGYGMAADSTGMRGYIKIHQNYRSHGPATNLFSAIYTPNVEDMYIGPGNSLLPLGVWDVNASEDGAAVSNVVTVPFGGYGSSSVPCMRGFGDIAIGVGDPGDPIPVELVSFSARYLDRSVRLNWQTATELNNNGFYVERSIDGLMWDEIAFVAGAGNSNVPIDYRYDDIIGSSLERVPQLAYRLRQEDRDGTIDYSSVVYAYSGLTPARVELYNAYPNPFNPSTSLSFYLEKDAEVTLRVHDLLGRVVASVVDDRREAGFHTIEFHGSELASGMYVAVLNADGVVLQEKLVLNK